MVIFKGKVYIFTIVVIFFTNCNNTSHPDFQKIIEDSPKYELLKDWPQLSDGYILSQPTGIGIDTSQNIFVFQRTGRQWTDPFPDSLISSNTILMLDRETGKILNSWGSNLFIMPHGLTVDNNNNVWVTDVALQQVFKFSHDGKLLMKLGVATMPGSDSLHFNLPTDVAVASDGSFYVSDGYGNSRIIKFSKSGKYLFAWGKKGSKPGEFDTPHAIDLDKKGNVYVADRENNRIQIFDANGIYLKEWKDTLSTLLLSITIDKTKQHLFAADFIKVNNTLNKGSDIIEFSSKGNLLVRFGSADSSNGPVCLYHDIAVDNQGSIYVAEVFGKRIQKFKMIAH